ncbi:MAG: SpoIIE family protein phosphatase [bacterium]
MLDANAAVSDQVMELLVGAGCQVHAVSDLEAAHTYCRQHRVWAAMSSELASCQAFAARHPQVPTLFVTAEPLVANELLQCLQAGVADCLQLPLSANEVVARLEACVTRSQTRASISQDHWRCAHDAMEHDLQAGRYIQSSLLPPTPQCIDDISLEHRLAPSMLLSGDFVDYFEIADGVSACYLADVSGHGSSAAFVTVLLKHFSAQLARMAETEGKSLAPGEVLTWMNNELLALAIDKHVAMFFACVDSAAGTLTYANAAQFPPAFLACGNNVVTLEQQAKPLGLFADVHYEAVEVAFPPGARLGVFTDGVLDLVSGATLPEKEKYLADVVQHAKDIDSIWSQLNLEVPGQDDVSCLLVTNIA